MPWLFRVVLPVTDIARGAGFYARLLQQEGRRVSPGRHYFDCEGTILACYDPLADGDGHAAMPIPEPVYLAVDDLEATLRRACQGGARPFRDASPATGALGEIALRPWGERSFYAWDPFGNPLCLVSRESVFLG